MTSRFGIDAAIFSIKAYLAAMLALYLALSIGLQRPYWAFLTSYIVAQPLAGAVVSKAMFRVIGTFVGAAAAVVMVPALDNAPELLTLAIGLWLGLCVFISLLDRTPRAYMFVLAGYSAILIALPSVEAPGTIFTVATLRVQEITLGILCGSLVHAVILPRSIAEFLLNRVAVIVRDAERWSRDSLELEPDAAVDVERRRLAQDITELHQLSIHLPFETSRIAPRVRTVRALQDQLSLLMPLGAAVADRVAQLRGAGGVPPAFKTLLADTRAWLDALGHTGRAAREDEAIALQARCAALEPAVAEGSSWRDLLMLSLAARLSALIAAHRDCRDLSEQLSTLDRRPVSPRVAELLEGRRDRELHRDVAGALRGATGAFLTIVVGSALWIASGWQDGSTAVMLAGVFLALFSASDDPLVPLRAFFFGTLIATLLGAIYGYAIMPRLDGFAQFAAAYAPPLLILGTLMHSPRWSGIALPTLLGLGSPLLIADRYISDFQSFINGAVAQLVGVAFAIVMARLLQSAGVSGAIRRTIRAGWIDIAERSTLMVPVDLRGWINRMLDRVALLAPRLAVSGRAPGTPLYDALRDLRTGVAIGELRQLRLDLPPDRGEPLRHVLTGAGAYYRSLDPDAPAPAGPGLLAEIDAAIHAFARDGDAAVRRAAALALVSLRRNLYPDADPAAEARA
ncbi:FUSC family protein [Hephaestia mangrovi]|uniref:FUSC family protein n=1 Tax=Hephaestia mangrovi TaxID=2873268 RepID=UPI001CA6CE8B|nr:FUSC family protein [Hephaestia mangrovi]MBY8827964.1 FUSC family protein [Hephaestia mangrovi]